ncbi:MAG: MFS transporter [Opitutaceae bacterium]|nr:MFS transporter [Opitutaceae bacterium]
MISVPWRVASFLFVAAGLNYADRTALASVLPPLREQLGATDGQLGLANTLFLWSYAIASPFAGSIADRFSRARMVLLSLVGWSAVTVATGLVQSVEGLYAARIALGITESLYLPAAAALLADHHGKETWGRATGFHLLGLNLGLVLGGAAAGTMAEWFGWRTGFWVLGGLGLALAFLAKPLLVDGPARPGTAGTAATPKAGFAESWAYLVRTPSFLCILLSAIAAGVASWIFLSWLPLFFSENYGMGLGAAGLAGVLLYKGPVFVGIAIGGWLSDRMIQRDKRARALIKALSFLLSAPFLFAFMGAPSFTLVAITMILSAIIRAVGTPSEHPIIAEIVPPQYRAAAVGLFNTCGTAAGGVGVLLAGILKQDLGLNVIFGASSFLYLLTGLLFLLAWRVWFAGDQDRAKAATAPA